MTADDYALILASWLRLPVTDVRGVLARLKRGGALPRAGACLLPSDAALGLVSVLLTSLEGPSNADACQAAGGMSLAGEPGVDPLDGHPRKVFGEMTGASLSLLSNNGYLNFVETVAAVLARHRENAGGIIVGRVSLRMWGIAPIGTVELTAGGEPLAYLYTPGGTPTPTAGLFREASVDGDALAGIAYVLSADAARRR